MNASAAVASIEKWPLRASDFALLCDAGAFADLRRAELIDGDIYSMSPQLTRHARIKARLTYVLTARLTAMGSDLEVIPEVSVIAAEHSVPQPDIVVSRYRGDRFMPADTVVLVVEVSDTTLANDLRRRAALYAKAAIPEYWVVDVNEQRVVTHWQPGAEGYAQRGEVQFGEVLASIAINGLSVNSNSLKPDA